MAEAAFEEGAALVVAPVVGTTSEAVREEEDGAAGASGPGKEASEPIVIDEVEDPPREGEKEVEPPREAETVVPP